ncbi:MAG: helix-turn-helix domain-containing protein [Acidobacteria bacterium]|nr:helix-turn-helix domain-containing protein [Acidobacteriota bacterium]MCW5967593.1 helix-turn-helix domain-containing protein [Blastocatellales bacterium]
MELLTTSEVAERLGVTRWRVNALIKSGRLKAEKKGQIFLVDARDLEAVADRKPGRPAKEPEAAPAPKKTAGQKGAKTNAR